MAGGRKQADSGNVTDKLLYTHAEVVNELSGDNRVL